MGIAGRIVALLCIGVAACTPVPNPNNPIQTPYPTEGVINARVAQPGSGSFPDTVFFGRIPWQTSNRGAPGTFAWGWRNDLLVQNPFAFQVRIALTLSNASFEVLDEAGQKIALTPNRVNLSYPCNRTAPGTPQPTPQGLCFASPGDADFVARPPVDLTKAQASLELIETCGPTIVPRPGDDGRRDRSTVCASGETSSSAAVLTLSPPSAVAPTNGQRFRFTLVAYQGSGATRIEQSWPIEAIFIAEDSCQITLTGVSTATPPPLANFGESLAIGWSATSCTSLKVTSNIPPPGLSQQPWFDNRITPDRTQFGTGFTGSMQLLMPDRQVQVTAVATDALGRVITRAGRLDVRPCSISPTHPSCPTRCSFTPRPADCPMTPVPPPPMFECPVEMSSRRDFQFFITCFAGGLSDRWQVPGNGCNRDEARETVRSIYAQELTPRSQGGQGCVLSDVP
jgi:hypothetical protein